MLSVYHRTPTTCFLSEGEVCSASDTLVFATSCVISYVILTVYQLPNPIDFGNRVGQFLLMHPIFVKHKSNTL